jgi:hypothetical protein
MSLEARAGLLIPLFLSLICLSACRAPLHDLLCPLTNRNSNHRLLSPYPWQGARRLGFLRSRLLSLWSHCDEHVLGEVSAHVDQRASGGSLRL